MYLYVKSVYQPFPDFDNANTTSYCATLHTPTAFCAKFEDPLPWQHCSSPRIAHIDPRTSVNDPASVRKKKKKGVCVCILDGACPCMCHVLTVCVCVSQFCNIISNIVTSGLWVVRIVFFAQHMHHDKISPNHEFVMWLLTRPVTHSLQSSRRVLAACHVVSVELVLTSLSSVRPPCSFYTLTTSFHGMNNWTHTQMCP